MQQGQIPERFLRGKAKFFTDVSAEDVVVLEWCIDRRVGFSMDLMIWGMSARSGCRRRRMWMGLRRSSSWWGWTDWVRMGRGDGYCR